VPGIVSKKDKILLLDDVFTTGNTILAAIKLLKEARIKRIKCLILSKKVL
jgi:predicted amidophosphoribosyltransferase